MKKTKFILLALAAALVLMGAAYAAWTQSLTITSNINTGELFVKIEDKDNTVQVDKAGDGHYVDAGINPDDVFKITKSSNSDGDLTISTIAYELNNMYPGTKITSKLNFTNIGTIGAAISATKTDASDNALWNELIVRVNGNVINGDSAQKKMENFMNAIKNAVGDLDISESKTVIIEQELPYSSTNATEKQSLTWSVNLNFTQNAK
jgi:hypothetical protein